MFLEIQEDTLSPYKCSTLADNHNVCHSNLSSPVSHQACFDLFCFFPFLFEVCVPSR